MPLFHQEEVSSIQASTTIEAKEEFVNSAWRGQRTSEEREPSVWERGEDHQEGGAQFCSSSTSGLQWEKVRV